MFFLSNKDAIIKIPSRQTDLFSHGSQSMALWRAMLFCWSLAMKVCTDSHEYCCVLLRKPWCRSWHVSLVSYLVIAALLNGCIFIFFIQTTFWLVGNLINSTSWANNMVILCLTDIFLIHPLVCLHLWQPRQRSNQPQIETSMSVCRAFDIKTLCSN